MLMINYVLRSQGTGAIRELHIAALQTAFRLTSSTKIIEAPPPEHLYWILRVCAGKAGFGRVAEILANWFKMAFDVLISWL